MSVTTNFRNVFIDGVRVYELIAFMDEHDNGNGILSVTIKFNAKKVEIDGDGIRVTTFKPEKP